MRLGKIRALLLAPVAVGAACGLLFSSVPFIFNFLFLALPFRFLYSDERYTVGTGLLRTLGSLSCFAVVALVCASLPIKELDQEVGPIHIENLTLKDACIKLKTEHGIPAGFITLPREFQARIVSFKTKEKLSKRRILNKLAEEQGLEFREGYCASEGTLLWGLDPAFCELRPKGK